MHIIKLYQRQCGSVMAVSREGNSYYIPIQKRRKRDRDSFELDPAFSGRPVDIIDILLIHFGFVTKILLDK